MEKKTWFGEFQFYFRNTKQSPIIPRGFVMHRIEHFTI
jgi:hypothetical protein